MNLRLESLFSIDAKMRLDKWADRFTISHQSGTFTNQRPGEIFIPPARTVAATAENAGGVLDVGGELARGWRGDRLDVSAIFQALAG
jgi:hypothetical protein